MTAILKLKESKEKVTEVQLVKQLYLEYFTVMEKFRHKLSPMLVGKAYSTLYGDD